MVWNATTCTPASSINNTTLGDTLVVTFANSAVLDINLYNWSDWTMYPNVSFTLVSAGKTPVPELASLALLGVATAGIGLVRRRRKTANAGR